MLRKEFNFQRKNKSSLIAFNVQNINHLDILKKASSATQKPVIAQFSSRYIKYWDDKVGMKNLVKNYQNNGVYFHLDHCNDTELIKFCADSGFGGVMFDGSHLPINENISISNELANYLSSKAKDTILEVEIGAIKGVEDGYEGAAKADYYSKSDLDLIVKNAQFDVLALAIGNAHGFYESTAEVKAVLLKEATTKYPELNLVLHGGTGLPQEMIESCIEYGVVKINVSTELKLQTLKAMDKYAKNFDMFNENEWAEFALENIAPLFEDYINKYTK